MKIKRGTDFLLQKLHCLSFRNVDVKTYLIMNFDNIFDNIKKKIFFNR